MRQSQKKLAIPCRQIGESFGNIFTQGLDEIWNGAKYRRLRKIVKSHMLPCLYCRQRFEAVDANATKT
ncbi:MAG: SPASM domain-containing protein [Candidatus Altiarchaeota archaeon]